MAKNKSSFEKDLEIESEVSEWLHKHYYSTEIFEEVVKTDQTDLQHKGVDVYQTSYEIFKDRLSHAVDEKCAITYVKKTHEEPRLDTFAFELNYKKDNKILDGWLYGDKYSHTEYYQVMWLWADVNPKNRWKYKYEEISRENITRVEGMVIKKSAIQRYLGEQGLNPNEIKKLRSILMRQEQPYNLEKGKSKIQISKNIPEEPMNVIIKSEKLKELSVYHFIQDIPVETEKIYSKTRLLNSGENIIDEIYRDVKSGIKNIIFSKNAKKLESRLKRKFSDKEYKYLDDSILIEINPLPKHTHIKNDLVVINGNLNIDIWKKNIDFYNWDQYEIEHANFKKNISVRAGAGSGKTRTMIQRILYLTLHKEISLNEIAMITFTNDAAIEMKERIEKVIYARFQITKQPLYLEFLENINKIKISTIDSFSKTIINQYNYKIGLGNDFRITSYIHRKQNIIKEVIDEKFRDEFRNMIKSNNLEVYELEKDIFNLWEKTLSLGVTPEKFKEYKVYNEEDRILKEIVAECHEHLSKEKEKEGKIDIYDLKFLSKEIIDGLLKQDLIYSRIKYLFVDEFQDTDNIQIDFIRKIHKELNVVLFIVGDEKQSIYRFRGAEHTAFNRIADSKEISFENYSLNINYRTNESLLKDMNKYFVKFRHLPKNEPLRAHRKNKDSKIQFINYKLDENQKPTEDYAEIFIDTFNKKNKSISKNSTLAILCRTNNEIDTIADILDKYGHEGKYTSSKSGDLFQRNAARDLVKFINLLLDENNLAVQLAAIDTPYFYQNMTPTEKLKKLDAFGVVLDSNNKKRLKILNEKKKFQPLLSILRESIMNDEVNGDFNHNLYIRYKQKEISEDEDFEVYREKYMTELNLIIEKIGDLFGNQTYSAMDIANWLTLQINSNQTDDVPPKQDMNQQVILTTIHKSKGLEFDHVLIPITHSPIFMHKRGFYIDYDEEEFVSNLHKNESGNDYKRNQNKETLELLEEETRILYVAMTRAKSSLVFFEANKYQNKSFAGILKGKC